MWFCPLLSIFIISRLYQNHPSDPTNRHQVITISFQEAKLRCSGSGQGVGGAHQCLHIQYLWEKIRHFSGLVDGNILQIGIGEGKGRSREEGRGEERGVGDGSEGEKQKLNISLHSFHYPTVSSDV